MLLEVLGFPLFPYCQPRQHGISCPIPAPPNSAEIHFYMKGEGSVEAGSCRCWYRLLVMPGEHQQCWEKEGSCIPARWSKWVTSGQCRGFVL